MARIIKGLLFLLIMSNNSIAIEYIQYYKTYTYDKSFNLDKILVQNNCTKLDIQRNIFNKRYPKLRIGQKVKVQTCFQNKTFTDEKLKIVEWKLITVKKNFILSKEIEKNKCSRIYTEQIPHFYEKNKRKPNDVNFIRKNQKILLQYCYSSEPKKTEINLNLNLDENKSATEYAYESPNISAAKIKEQDVKEVTEKNDELALSLIADNKSKTFAKIAYREKIMEFGFILKRKSFESQVGFGYMATQTARPHLLFGFRNEVDNKTPIKFLMPGVGFFIKNIDLFLDFKIENSMKTIFEIDYLILNNIKISIYNERVNSENQLGAGIKFLF